MICRSGVVKSDAASANLDAEKGACPGTLCATTLQAPVRLNEDDSFQFDIIAKPGSGSYPAVAGHKLAVAMSALGQ